MNISTNLIPNYQNIHKFLARLFIEPNQKNLIEKRLKTKREMTQEKKKITPSSFDIITPITRKM